MKKVFKMGCLGFIALIVIGVIINMASGGGDKSSSKPAATTSSTSATTKSSDSTKTTPSSSSQPASTQQNNQQTDSTKGVLTKAKFDQIKNGMTYDQVTQIIGSKGELQSETGTKGSPYYTAIYSFQADGDLGANATMMFQGGKLINKAQFGLGGDSNATINMAKFNQIQNGMTYEQVQKIVGGSGQIISESGNKGSADYTIMVEYNGDGNLGANANFMFQGDKLQSKAQMGLN